MKEKLKIIAEIAHILLIVSLIAFVLRSAAYKDVSNYYIDINDGKVSGEKCSKTKSQKK